MSVIGIGINQSEMVSGQTQSSQPRDRQSIIWLLDKMLWPCSGYTSITPRPSIHGPLEFINVDGNVSSWVSVRMLKMGEFQTAK